MIRIHVGVVDAPPTPGAIVIGQPQDYIMARDAIRDAWCRSEDLDVFVTTRICDEWFWDLENAPDLKLLQDSPIELLCQKLHIPCLPSEIADPELISGHALLSLPTPTEPPSDIVGWVLAHKLSDVWAVSEPSYSHLTKLISWWSRNTVPQGMETLSDRRMHHWMSQARGQLAESYRAIYLNPQKSSMFLSCWKALSIYEDEILIHWLEEEGWYFPSLRWIAASLSDLPLPPLADQKLSPKAKIYWRRCLKELNKSA